MKLICQICLVCLLTYCSNMQEEREKARRNYFLCILIVLEQAKDTQMAATATVACTFRYPEAFKKNGE